jgi:hydrogenase maturation protease
MHREGGQIGLVGQMRNPRGSLVLFLGNTLLSDDRIGLIVGEMLKEKLESEGYEVEVLEKTGFSLVDYLENRDEAVIVDSVMTGRHQVGQVVSLNLDDLQQYAPFTSHYVGIPEALRLMRQLDLNPPTRLRILGIEVEDPYTISEKISDKLASRLNQLAQEIHKIIGEETGRIVSS